MTVGVKILIEKMLNPKPCVGHDDRNVLPGFCFLSSSVKIECPVIMLIVQFYERTGRIWFLFILQCCQYLFFKFVKVEEVRN